MPIKKTNYKGDEELFFQKDIKAVEEIGFSGEQRKLVIVPRQTTTGGGGVLEISLDIEYQDEIVPENNTKVGSFSLGQLGIFSAGRFSLRAIDSSDPNSMGSVYSRGLPLDGVVSQPPAFLCDQGDYVTLDGTHIGGHIFTRTKVEPNTNAGATYRQSFVSVKTGDDADNVISINANSDLKVTTSIGRYVHIFRESGGGSKDVKIVPDTGQVIHTKDNKDLTELVLTHDVNWVHLMSVSETEWIVLDSKIGAWT